MLQDQTGDNGRHRIGTWCLVQSTRHVNKRCLEMKSGTAMAAISRRIVARNVRRPTGEFVDIRPF
jgi:hypothetical protein